MATTNPLLEYILYPFELIRQGAENFYHNATNMWTGMDWVRWLRLVAIVGAYLLLRPYFQRYSEKIQQRQMEAAMRPAEAEVPTGIVSANDLRGGAAKGKSGSEDRVSAGGSLAGQAKRRLGKGEKAGGAGKAVVDDDWSDPDVSDLLT